MSAQHIHTAVHTKTGYPSCIQCHDIRHSLHGNPCHALQPDSFFCHQNKPAIAFYGSPLTGASIGTDTPCHRSKSITVSRKAVCKDGLPSCQFCFFPRNKQLPAPKAVWVHSCCLCLSHFLTTEVESFLWHVPLAPPMSENQGSFPWQRN